MKLYIYIYIYLYIYILYTHVCICMYIYIYILGCAILESRLTFGMDMGFYTGIILWSLQVSLSPAWALSDSGRDCLLTVCQMLCSTVLRIERSIDRWIHRLFDLWMDGYVDRWID